METKRISDYDFFTRSAKDVAKDLLGKFILYKSVTVIITATEAYEHNENFCYGNDKTKEDAKKHVTAPLFESPGTWCIYGGQLLLSVTDDKHSDNVLIKQVKDMDGKNYDPNAMAELLHLYKTKPAYCECHGQYSLSEASNVYLTDGEPVQNIVCSKRVRIDDDNEYNFSIGK